MKRRVQLHFHEWEIFMDADIRLHGRPKAEILADLQRQFVNRHGASAKGLEVTGYVVCV